MGKRHKLIERMFVEWFVNKINWPCKVFDDEGPDFRIEFQEKIVGLEVTGIYKSESPKGSSVRSVESLRSNWLSEVAEQYYRKSRFPIVVDVLTTSGNLCHPECLASELSERSNNIEILGTREFEFRPSAECALKIWFQRLPDRFERYNWWTCIDNHVGVSRPLDRSAVQAKIVRKAAKLSRYKKKYDEIILLIVADRTYNSGMFHTLNGEISASTLGFSSVFLALYPEGCIRIS